jgi:hypothetical protein
MIKNNLFFNHHIDEFYEILNILKERNKWELY